MSRIGVMPKDNMRRLRGKKRKPFKIVSINQRTYRLVATAYKRAGGSKEQLSKWVSGLLATGLGLPCIYCRVALQLDNVSLDHKVPLSRGGANVEENLQLVCRRCNGAKGSFTNEEFAALVAACASFDRYMKQYLYSRLMAATRVFRRWKR